MEKKEIAIGPSVTISGVTITPVVEVLRNYGSFKGTTLHYHIKQPIAVVVDEATTRRAFRITGEEIPVDQLLNEVPEIVEMLPRT